MAVYFTIKQDVLCKEFVGTIDEFKAKFAEDKETCIKDVEKALEEHKSKSFDKPDDYAEKDDADKKVIDLSLETKKAENERSIERLNKKLEYVKNMKLSDIELFELTPIKVEE